MTASDVLKPSTLRPCRWFAFLFCTTSIVLVAWFVSRNGSVSKERDQSSQVLYPTELALERRLPEVWMEDVLLDEAVRWLSHQLGLPIEIDATAFQVAGISATVRTTLRFRNVTLATVAQSIMRSVETRSTLRFEAMPDRLVLSARTSRGSHDQSYWCVRTYDVSDLLNRIKRQGQTGRAGAGGGIGSLRFSSIRSSSQPGSEEHSGRLELLKLISSSIGWHAWSWETKGIVGFVGDQLLVTDSLSNHRVVRRAISHLCATPAGEWLRGSRPAADEEESFQWNATLKRWTSMSPSKGLDHLDRQVDGFRIENRPLADAFRLLCNQAEVPMVMNEPPSATWEQWASRRTSVVVQDVDLRTAVRMIVSGTLLHADSEFPWDGRDPQVNLDGEVVILNAPFGSPPFSGSAPIPEVIVVPQ